MSESAAAKLTSYVIEQVRVNVNTNDILVNCYGTQCFYKSFPDIGEEVRGRVLLARRRIDYDSAFFDLSSKNLGRVNHGTDTIFYTEGQVVDIDVFSNASVEKLEDYPYNRQVAQYLRQELEFHQRMVEVLEPVVSRKRANHSADVGYLYRRAKDVLDPEVRWRDDGSDFDNLVLRFTVVKEQGLVRGSKLTNRSTNQA